MINTNNQNNKNKINNTCFNCVCICFTCIFLLGLVSLAVASFVVWILALVNGKNLNIDEKCSDNKLWEWLLIWGIITFMSICSKANSKKEENDNIDHNKWCGSCCKLFCYMILIGGHITLCWWGRQQLEHNNWCLDKTYGDTLFYKVSFIYWWIEFIGLCIICGLIGISFISVIIYLIIINCTYKSDDNKETILDLNNDLNSYKYIEEA